MPTLSQGALVTKFRTLYVPSLATNAFDLSAVDLSGYDCLLIDDTGGSATCVLTLPKIGSALAPIGLRLTIRKASTVNFTVSITPSGGDSISGTPGAYPSVMAINTANTIALPVVLPNSVTIEATPLAAVGGLPILTVSPTVGGVWEIVTSSVASV